MGVAEDGRAEAEEGFVKDDGGDERSVGEVDLREGVVETPEGVAYESGGRFGAQFISGPHVEDDGGCVVRGGRIADDVRDEFEY